MKRILTVLCVIATLTTHAQNADDRIYALMEEARWFDLARELAITPSDSVDPLLHKMARAMTYHYFNKPDSVCYILSDLLNNHQEELGSSTLSMATLMGMNLARTNNYAEAASLMQSLYGQMKAQGTDSTQANGYLMLARQYKAYAENAPICHPLHPTGTYRIPMKTDNTMHKAKDKTSNGHLITMDGRINGHGSTLVFDTGAGVNIISPTQARDYGLRKLDATSPMAGIGTQQGFYALADTLRIGGMAWTNVPFLVVDIKTGNAKADSICKLLPPVIGLPIMLSMQEIQLDFENRQIIIPAKTTPRPFNESNLLRTDAENLLFATTEENGKPLYFHFDTGGYGTTFQSNWYERHKDEVQAVGTPDSLRVAGVGGTSCTHSYRLPHKKIRIGQNSTVLDSVIVDTGIDLYTGEQKRASYLSGKEDSTLGLDILEHFKLVIINFKDMYMNAIPFLREKKD